MALIIVLLIVAFVAGFTALGMAISDFRRGPTFRSATAVAIYVGWSCHGAAFVAAIVLDPYRIAAVPLLAAVVGIPLSASGSVMFILGLRRFQSFEQVTGTEVGGLVTSGLYRISRHPQYTGWILLLAGAAVAARSPIALSLAVVALIAMRIWIPHEERHLEEEFGDDYLRYRRQVPRFLGVNLGGGSVIP